MENLEGLRDEILAAVRQAPDLGALEGARISALGRKGRITALMKELGALAADERRHAGQILNALHDDVTAAIAQRKRELGRAELDARLAEERIDVTLPVRPGPLGRIHPISQTIDEVVAIFGEMGFQVAEGPDIEDDWYNFTALNIPPEHPARQEMDTFYLPGAKDGHRLVLRTHTSPVQIRTMQERAPPLRIIVPGRTYRCDSDATHSPMFHQVEGLMVDESTHFGHLKGCLIEFCRAYFGIEDLPVRFRPSYFPFTEPSAELDAIAGNGWIEMLGCGMVHPNVLEAVGYDPQVWQGFAFGMGIDRIAALRFGITDIRIFYENDTRFLRQFAV